MDTVGCHYEIDHGHNPKHTVRIKFIFKPAFINLKPSVFSAAAGICNRPLYNNTKKVQSYPNRQP